jgi:hypothetical protein
MRRLGNAEYREATVWIVGTLLLFVIAVVVVLAIGWAPRAKPSPPLWNIPSLGGAYVTIVGTIGGFSVAGAIFIASVDDARTSPAFATVIGMLLLAFLILVFSALIYASAPGDPNTRTGEEAPALSHILANMSGCVGLSVSWLAFVPLLQMIELPELAVAFTWLLLFVVIGASAWTAIFAYRLTLANAAACLAMPVLGYGLAALYRLAAARLWPSLWPDADAALRIAFAAVAVGGLTFSLHSDLLLMYGNDWLEKWLRRYGHRVALACSQSAVLAVALIWFAVAWP